MQRLLTPGRLRMPAIGQQRAKSSTLVVAAAAQPPRSSMGSEVAQEMPARLKGGIRRPGKMASTDGLDVLGDGAIPPGLSSCKA